MAQLYKPSTRRTKPISTGLWTAVDGWTHPSMYFGHEFKLEDQNGFVLRLTREELEYLKGRAEYLLKKYPEGYKG